MTDFKQDIYAIAAQWVVRAMSDDISETDIVALTAWLDAAPLHVEAYQEALAVWATTNDLRRDTRIEVVPLTAVKHSKKLNTGWLGGGVTLIAASLIGGVIMVNHIPANVYETSKGQRRDVVLSDGSHLMLNTDTRVVTRIGRSREVTLEKGEIALDVKHDQNHRFIVKTGHVVLTDIGTAFNVSNLDDVIRVNVSEGEVRFRAKGQVQNLYSGDQGTHNEMSGQTSFARVDSKEAYAWQTAHAIYHNRTLLSVAKDLNRYFSKPIVVDESAANLRTTIILSLDSPAAVAGRLSEFLPLDVRTTNEAIYLSYRADDGSADHQ